MHNLIELMYKAGAKFQAPEDPQHVKIHRKFIFGANSNFRFEAKTLPSKFTYSLNFRNSAEKKVETCRAESDQHKLSWNDFALGNLQLNSDNWKPKEEEGKNPFRGGSFN